MFGGNDEGETPPWDTIRSFINAPVTSACTNKELTDRVSDDCSMDSNVVMSRMCGMKRAFRNLVGYESTSGPGTIPFEVFNINEFSSGVSP